METYVVDTHSLIWYIAEDGRLSEHAERLLDKAEDAEVQVLVPTVVLAEIAYIAWKKKVKITLDTVLERIEQGDGFAIVGLDRRLGQQVHRSTGGIREGFEYKRLISMSSPI